VSSLTQIHATSDFSEAYLVRAALDMAGIQAHVDGEFLQQLAYEVGSCFQTALRVIVCTEDAPRAALIVGRLLAGEEGFDGAEVQGDSRGEAQGGHPA